MDAISATEQLNEVKRLNKVLKDNPNDVESIVKLATFLKTKLELKRKLLNKALSLDPTHKAAREMLLELDRAEMMGGQSQIASSSHEKSAKAEKTFVFRSSIIPRIFVYLLLAFTVYCWFDSIQDPALPGFTVLLLLLLIALWFVSAVTKVNSWGVKVSRLFGIFHQEISWSDVAAIKSLALGRGISLTPAEGKAVNISPQLPGHSAIVENLRRIRPDLFEMSNSESASPTGIKTFQKSPIIKIAPFFLGIFGCLISLGTLFAAPPLGIIFIIFTSILCVIQLNNPHTVIVQGDQLSTKSILKGGEWVAEQIRDIRMSYVQNRYGFKRNFIHVEIAGGKALRLYGFTGGDEMMYGFLKNWWNTYRNN